MWTRICSTPPTGALRLSRSFLPIGQARRWAHVPAASNGNAVVAPDGTIANYLRIDLASCHPRWGKAVVLKGNNADPEAPLTLDRIVDCPVGSNSKFQLYRDPVSQKYIMIGTEQSEDTPGRTVLSMAVSEDFYTWRVAKRILDYRTADPKHIGFNIPTGFLMETTSCCWCARPLAAPTTSTTQTIKPFIASGISGNIYKKSW